MNPYERQERPEQPNRLPIVERAQEIKELIVQNPTSIIVGETGSGKTTHIPLMLLDALPPSAKIAVTQPRRIAATSVARYVASRRGSPLGKEIGYQVRFDNQTTRGTQANFYTDGILLRKIQEDPSLLEYDAVMVDEAHERNLDTDLLLGLLKNIQQQRKDTEKPLRIVVTSATLEEEKFSAFFDNAPVARVSGRQFPVVIHYQQPEGPITQTAAQKAKEIVEQEGDGSILIFMPGITEIRDTIKTLQQFAVDAIVLPLHGQLTTEEQERVFQSGKRRRIIVATNIAETSVTIPNVHYVIDSGLIRQTAFNPDTGIEALILQKQAQSGCDQRAGRAGRVAPGVCYRLYSQRDYEKRNRFKTPEIQRTNIGKLVLYMKALGITDIENFDFIDSPGKDQLAHAIVSLQNLGALDNEENLTETGKFMTELPLEPHAARSVVEAIKRDCVTEISTIFAFEGLHSPFRIRGEKAEIVYEQFRVADSDFLTLLKVWEQFTTHGQSKEWAEAHSLNYYVLEEATKTRNQILAISSNVQTRQNARGTPEAIAKSLLAGHVDMIMVRVGNQYRLVTQPAIPVFFSDSAAAKKSTAPFLVTSRVREINHVLNVNICQSIAPEWIAEVAPQVLVEQAKPKQKTTRPNRILWSYNPKTGEVQVNGASIQTSDLPEEAIREKQQVVRMFAHELAQGNIRLPKEILEHNQRIIATVWEYWKRSGGNLPNGLRPEQAFRPQGLTRVFEKRLGTISSKEELAQALEKGTVDLLLRIEDYIPPEIRETIIFDASEISVSPQTKKGKAKKLK